MKLYNSVSEKLEQSNGSLFIYIIPGVTEMDIKVVICHGVIMKTTNIMDIRLCSFNCKDFNISKVKHITEILKSCEIILVRETWLLSSQIGTINIEFSNYNTFWNMWYKRRNFNIRQSLWRLFIFDS